MTTPTTAEQYAAFARRNPAKARRYQRSIAESLERETIHPLERERLTDALAGLASVLGEPPATCRRCGEAISSTRARACGYGSHCERVAS